MLKKRILREVFIGRFGRALNRIYVEGLAKLGGAMPIEKSDLPQGTLDMLILRIVELGPVHGYGISQRIRQISKEMLQVQQGSLYPTLHRLEKRGWLSAERGESNNGRQAKFYKLSAKGRKHLASEESNWHRRSDEPHTSGRTIGGGHVSPKVSFSQTRSPCATRF
jgi:transcriptional regulator